MRKTREELDEFMKEKGADRLWSFSRVSTFITSPYEYFLRYVKKVPEDRLDCIYTATGTLAHDILDKFYEKKINYKDMIQEFKDGWAVNRDMADLKFDRNDSEKDKTIAEKYYNDLYLCFKNYIPIKEKICIEPFVTTNIDGNIFIGYIDAIYKDENGIYNIIDFKTSSKYTGDSLKEHSGQLILYAIALNQKGIPFENIRCKFDFLKYVNVSYEQKNGKIKMRSIERSKLGSSLNTPVKMWLKEFSYDEDTSQEYLDNINKLNDLSILPDNVKEKFIIENCYVEVPLDSSIDKWATKITNTIKDIELREKDYKRTGSEKVFYDTEESVAKESYYFATLCGYSQNKHIPYRNYLEKLERKESGEDLFDNVGSDLEVEVSNTSVSDGSLDWLDEL